MRLKKIHIQSVLNYDDFVLEFNKRDHGLYLIYGPNEVGKSTLLQVLIDLLFGGKADPNLYGSASRIRALIDVAGKEHAIFRRKRYSRIEVDPNEEGLSEEEIARLLGGYTEEQYQLLFGFNHERLRAGGESLLESEGEAGISLFETGGGLQNLQRLLTELDERSRNLLEPNFRTNSKRKINIAVRSYNNAIQTLRDISLKGDDYQKLRKDFLTKQQHVQTLAEKKKQLDQKREQLERIKRTRPKVFELEHLQSTLKNFKDFTPLPDEYIDWIPQKIEQLNEEKALLQTLEAEKRARETKMNEIQIDHDILAFGEEIDRLYQDLGQYKTRKYEEIPQEREQLQQLQMTAREIFQRLAPELSTDQLESLRIPFADEESIIKYAKRLNEHKKDKENIKGQLAEWKGERKKHEEELAKIGELKDISSLKHFLIELRKIGDLDKTLATKKADIHYKQKEIDQSLKQQGIWTKTAEELMETSLPLLETIEQYQAIWQKYTNKLEELQRSYESIEQDLRRIKHELEEIEQSGDIPVEEELLAAREHREMGWELIKKVWLEKVEDAGKIQEYAGELQLHQAYEQAVQRADEIVDTMRKESELSAKRSHLLLRQEQLKKDLAHIKETIATEEEAFSQFKEKWQQEWTASGIHAKSPQEMKAWYSTFYQPLVADFRKLQLEQNEYQTLLEQKQQFHDRLIKELANVGLMVDANKDLNDLIKLAEDFIEGNDKKHEQVTFINKSIDNIADKLAELEDKLAELEEHINECEQRLDLFRMKYPHLPDDAEMIEVYIEQIRNLFEHVDIIKQKRTILNNKEQAVQAFEKRTGDLAEHFNERLDEYVSHEQYLRELRDRYRVASENLSNQKQFKQEIQELEEKIVTKNRELTRLQDEIGRYLTIYHCKREEELLQLVERSRQFKELQEKINTTIQELQERAGAFFTIEKLVNEVKSAPEDTDVDRELETVVQNIQEIEERLNEENRLLGQLEEQLNQLDGSDTRAADLAQDAEVYMTEIDRYWNEFLRVEIARKMLQRAIERFREENEGAIIEKAGTFFEKLTLGNYQGLSIEYDGVKPYIEVLHHTGQKWRVSSLSDGARDQLYLALRLAFIDQHFDSELALPIIMDDILVNFDDERALATLKVLDGLAEKMQILYFTHHRTITGMYNQLKNAEVIALDQLKQKTL